MQPQTNFSSNLDTWFTWITKKYALHLAFNEKGIEALRFLYFTFSDLHMQIILIFTDIFKWENNLLLTIHFSNSMFYVEKI